MANYATGKHAKAISDRSGMEFPYREMVREWNGMVRLYIFLNLNPSNHN